MADRATIGNVEVQVFVDATPPAFEPNQFFPEVPLEAWEPHRKECLDADGKFRTNFCFFVLRSQGRVVLVDTGLGPGPFERLGGARGELMTKLQGAGINPQDVETVVITHLHGDHIGWNVTTESDTPRATFPRARYLIPRGDWEHFTKPEVLENTPAVKANAVPLQDLGVMELVDGDHAVTPEISTLATPGHTPGHLSVVITSQGQRGVVVGDLFHSAAQVTEPDWCAGADMDKDLARRTRHATLDRLEGEGFTVAAGHLLINTNIGKLVRVEGRRYWQAL